MNFTLSIPFYLKQANKLSHSYYSIDTEPSQGLNLLHLLGLSDDRNWYILVLMLLMYTLCKQVHEEALSIENKSADRG